MTRWRAFALHLTLSCLIGGGVLALFLLVWYPPPLFAASGGAKLLLTILGVDVVLGPLLTLVVYRPGKPGLRFDLTAIAILQSLALGYGFHVAWASRPVYIAVQPHRATLVHANELHITSTATTGLHKLPKGRARVVGVEAPTEEWERQAIIQSLMDGRPDIEYRPEYYRPLATQIAQVLPTSRPLSALLDQHAACERAVDRWLAARGLATPEGLRYLPLITHDEEIVFIFDAEGAPLGPLGIPSD